MRVRCLDCGYNMKTKDTMARTISYDAHFYGEFVNDKMRKLIGVQCKKCGSYSVAKMKSVKVVMNGIYGI